MKNIKLFRTICITVLLVVALNSFVSCGHSENEDITDTTNSAVQDDTNTIPSIDGIVIASNGKSEYTVYIENEIYSDAILKARVEYLCDVIKKKSGATIDIKRDSEAKAEDFDKPAILVGKTSFKESSPKDGITRDKDYYVDYVGNKIVLYSQGLEGARYVIEDFIELIDKQSAENKTVYYMDNYTKVVTAFSYELNRILCCGEELASYRIVIPKNATQNEKQFAYMLRYRLDQAYGHRLNVVTDDEPEVDCEILVGAISRSEVNIADNTFTVAANNKKLVFCAMDMRGYEDMYEYVANTLFISNNKEVAIDNGFSYTANAAAELSDGTLFATQNNGDVRVMLWNVNGYENAAIRQLYQIEVFKTYKPTVIGIQEASGIYHRLFTSQLEALGYTWITTDAGTSDYTPLYYLESEVTLKDSGRVLYSGANNSDSKSVSWGVFQDKETGKLFAVLNTHFMYNAASLTSEEANATRVSNATQAVKIIKETILAKYSDISIVFGGDLNSKIGSDPHNVLKEAGLVAAWDVAETKNDTVGYGGGGTYSKDDGCYIQVKNISSSKHTSAIDNIYVTPNTKVMSYGSLLNMYCRLSSDHMPLLIDIDLK